MSAKGHACQWWGQRLSAIGLIPLGLWFLWSLKYTHGLPYAEVIRYFAQPWNAAFLSLLLMIGAYHSAVGFQSIIEDYIHCKGWKTYLLIKIQLGWVVVVMIGFFFILRIFVLGTITGDHG